MNTNNKVCTLTEDEGWNLVCMIEEAREKIQDESELISAVEEGYEITDEQKEQLVVANRLLPKEDYRSEQVLFATEAFQEDESEELASDDPSTSHMDIAEHMISRDRKQLVYSYEEGRYNTPVVDGVEMDIYSQLCWDVSNTEEHAEGGKKCGFTLTPTGGHDCDIEWEDKPEFK